MFFYAFFFSWEIVQSILFREFFLPYLNYIQDWYIEGVSCHLTMFLYCHNIRQVNPDKIFQLPYTKDALMNIYCPQQLRKMQFGDFHRFMGHKYAIFGIHCLIPLEHEILYMYIRFTKRFFWNFYSLKPWTLVQLKYLSIKPQKPVVLLVSSPKSALSRFTANLTFLLNMIMHNFLNVF